MSDGVVIEGVGKDARVVDAGEGAVQSELPYAFQHLDPQALFAMAAVMYEGAKKYGPPAGNWRRISAESHINHMISHAYAWLAGDRSDDHLAHMACRAMGALQAGLTDTEPARDGIAEHALALLRELDRHNITVHQTIGPVSRRLRELLRLAGY